MELVKVTSYHEYCDPYVIEQYRDSTRLRALIDSVLAQCDDLEQAWLEILEALDIANAVGPALDSIGAIVGVIRIPGETDDAYRVRVLRGNYSEGLPSMEALRTLIRLATGSSRVGLYPVWPAGLYYVQVGGRELLLGEMDDDLTSGSELLAGTFLRCEDNGPFIIDEDHGQPFVIDAFPKDQELYELVTDTGDGLVDENGDSLAALDF